MPLQSRISYNLSKAVLIMLCRSVFCEIAGRHTHNNIVHLARCIPATMSHGFGMVPRILGRTIPIGHWLLGKAALPAIALSWPVPRKFSNVWCVQLFIKIPRRLFLASNNDNVLIIDKRLVKMSLIRGGPVCQVILAIFVTHNGLKKRLFVV